MVEPPDFQLRRRPSLELSVDYRPARPHHRQETRFFHCPRKVGQSLITFDPRPCEQLDLVLTLKPGLGTYEVPFLDEGWLVPETWIDDERFFGLANHYSLEIDEDSPDSLVSPVLLVKEDHIFGHLLLAGEAVAGEVRLEAPSPAFGPARRAPTDEELLYHLFYFGAPPDQFGRNLLPEELRDLEGEELRGLFYAYSLRACDLRESCRLFHHRSTLSGSGRLDLDLGSALSLDVRVVEAESGRPISGAWVRTAALEKTERKKAETLHFLDGEVVKQSGHTLEGYGTTTDSDGRSFLRDQPPGPLILVVHAEGFDELRRDGVVASAEATEVRVELQPEDRVPRGGPSFRDLGGKPLANAALLAISTTGELDYRCSARTSSLGEPDLKEGCLSDPQRRFLLLHADAALEILDTPSLVAAGFLVTRQAPAFPLRLRVENGAGEPLAGVAVELRIDGIELGPNHLVAAMTRTGYPFALATDGRGEIVFPFLSSQDHSVEAHAVGNLSTAWTPIPPLPAGEAFLLIAR
ncbi:MAG: hypothetical protein KDD47_27170 [Acidobacteria bacterium]|nr:hypothetical protein [Acidobacteriota bacterium]